MEKEHFNSGRQFIIQKGDPTRSNSERKTEYNIKYAKDKLKRIPLDVQKEKYEEIKTAATAAGKTVNGYIKIAIDERMERDANTQYSQN